MLFDYDTPGGESSGAPASFATARSPEPAASSVIEPSEGASEVVSADGLICLMNDWNLETGQGSAGLSKHGKRRSPDPSRWVIPGMACLSAKALAVRQ